MSWMNKAVILSENSEFAQLYKTVILFSDFFWDKSLDPRANWSKLEHMYTTSIQHKLDLRHPRIHQHIYEWPSPPERIYLKIN